jgi:anti-anti-sigma factor
MTELRVTISPDVDHVVVSPNGKICFDTLEALTAALDGYLTGSAPRIVVDLGEVTMCDSSCLQVLVNTYRRVTGAGGWLRLADPQPLVLRVLQITHLDQLLPIYDTVDRAVSGD